LLPRSRWTGASQFAGRLFSTELQTVVYLADDEHVSTSVRHGVEENVAKHGHVDVLLHAVSEDTPRLRAVEATRSGSDGI
jgi:hypothetical protein